jgi:hypothetical protein
MFVTNLIVGFLLTLLNGYYFFILRKITTKRAFKYFPVMDFKNADDNVKKVHYKYIATIIGVGITAILKSYFKNHP